MTFKPHKANVLSVKVNAENFFGPLEYYDHYSEPKGLALLMNNFDYGDCEETRRGSDIDYNEIDYLLRKEWGYKVQFATNRNKRGMLHAVESFADQFSTGNYHSCVVVLMTHGRLGEFLTAGLPPYELLSEHEFMNPIVNNIALKGIPKIFIFQSCRKDHSSLYDSNVIRSTISDEVPSDTYIFYSTSPGCLSSRSRYWGSPFIQVLCGIFKRYAHESWANIEKLAQRVIKVFISSPQKPVLKRNASKKFHFFPIEHLH